MLKLRIAVVAAAMTASIAVGSTAFAQGNSPVRNNCGAEYDHAHVHWVVTGNGRVQTLSGPNYFVPDPKRGLHNAGYKSGAVNHQMGVYCSAP
jgi:hypothetical protein